MTIPSHDPQFSIPAQEAGNTARAIIQSSEFRVAQSRMRSMKNRVPPKLKKLSAAKQKRLDELLDKNAEGTITVGEKARLQQLVSEAEQLMVTNAKRLAEFT